MAKKRKQVQVVDIAAIEREAYARGKRDAEAHVQAQLEAKRRDAWEKAERERNYERTRQEQLNDPFEQARLDKERQDRFGW